MEKILLKGLISSDEYAREITPYIKPEYFETLLSKTLFQFYYDYFNKYNCNPTKDYFELEIEKYDLFNEEQFSDGKEMITEIFDCDISKYDKEWFKSESEKWCQNRAIINAVMDSISVIDGSDKKRSTHAIPDMMRDALSVSFDTHIGHDYIEDHAERYAFYHDVSQKFGFDMEYFNRITNGGVSRKTLNCILAMTGGGKSQLMCHLAASYMKAGLNVLYVTCEMAEERIAERIDANMMDMNISDVAKMSEMNYIKKIDKINKSMMGKMVIKEYPTATANVNHLRQLLQELKMKKNFIPDVLIVDYLGIMTSSRYSGNSNANSYTIVKAIAEELRGLVQDENMVGWTGHQTNRDGIDSSDLSMTNIADSVGLAYTCDLLFGIISIPELEERGQVMIKQLKNRYNDMNTYNKFIIGVNRAKMQFFDLAPTAQVGLHSTEQAPFDDEKGSAGFGYGSEHAESKDKFNEVNFD